MDEYISKSYLLSKLRDGQFETGGMLEVIQGRELEPFTIYKSLVVAWKDIQNAPTADVVPKSEVEQAKQEVAREIFEEIENRLLPSNTSGEFRGDSIEWFDYYDLHLAEDIAELKKKYTGDQT